MAKRERLVHHADADAPPSRVAPRRKSEGDRALDAGLMERALGGEAEALEALLEAYWAPIAAYAARVLDGNLDAGKDVAQEVFVLIWEQRVRWRQTGSVRAYLYGLARNIALNQRRSIRARGRASERVRAQFEERERTLSPLELVELGEERDAIDHAIAMLPKRRREVFLLIRVHGASYREAAEILGVSPQTIANQMSRALAELRRLL